MRIFFAGASGVIGKNLIPLLVQEGHFVGGLTRSESKIDAVRALGAQVFLCDVYDLAELKESVDDFKPDMVMNQLTDLPDNLDDIPATAQDNQRIREVGTANLIEATKAANCSRFMAQSVNWELPGEAGESIKRFEQSVLDFGGVVLRYGQFYGPGTYYEYDEPEGTRIDIRAAARRTVEELDAPNGTVVTIEE